MRSLAVVEARELVCRAADDARVDGSRAAWPDVTGLLDCRFLARSQLRLFAGFGRV